MVEQNDDGKDWSTDDDVVVGFRQASGQSLQVLADITIPSLFGRTVTPRSANLFNTRSCPLGFTSNFSMLKHVRPRCAPSQPNPLELRRETVPLQ